MAGYKTPEDFRVWQLAWELKERVFAFTERAPARLDGKFCEAIRESARSAPDNVAEGFYRFNPPDFANFVRIARGSLGEVGNQLKHARARRYLTDAEFRDLSHLCRRAMGAAAGLRLYLLKTSTLASCPKGIPPGEDQKATLPARNLNPEPEHGTEPGTRTWNRNRNWNPGGFKP